MSLKLLGIYTNPMPQHQGGQVTTQGPTPVQTNLGLSASANTIRACTAARREMPVRPSQVLSFEGGSENSKVRSHFLCP